jgi:hypothetical protein
MPRNPSGDATPAQVTITFQGMPKQPRVEAAELEGQTFQINVASEPMAQADAEKLIERFGRNYKFKVEPVVVSTAADTPPTPETA